MKFALRSAIVALSLSVGSVALSGVSAHANGIDEVRFGGTWANPDAIDNGHPEADQAGITAEVLFSELNLDTRTDAGDDFIHQLLTPRIHVGGMYNFDDDGTSYVYAGLTWHHELTDTIFFESTFGGAINDGSETPTATRAGLGSSVTFRESIALGFSVTESTNVIVQLEHLSHANLAGDFNRGLTNASVKVGFKF